MKSRNTFVIPAGGDIVLPKTTHKIFNAVDRGFVTTDSPAYLKKCVYQLSLFFMREFHYDFVQFSVSDPESIHDEYYAYIWHKYSGWQVKQKQISLVFGAAYFSYKRTTSGLSGKWSLDWIWLHPYERNRGHLKKTWPFFIETFGNFRVETPLSHAMYAFLEKYASIGQREEAMGFTP